MPGTYELVLTAGFADGTSEVSAFPVRIGRALRPWENVQVNAWNEYSPAFRDTGITMAHSGLEAQKIDRLAAEQMYGNYNLHYFGTPRPGNVEDFATDSYGKNTYPDIRSEYIRGDIVKHGRMIAESVQDAPTFRAIVLNTEQHAGGAGMSAANFSQREMRIAKSFGLDLEKWRLSGKKNEEYFKYMPLGYLGTAPAPELVPESRSIPADNPLYAYMRERHGADGGTEVVTNDLLAETILKVRPDTMMMQDPVMRRPALRSYRKINVAQDWFYYTELSVIVNGAENLGAVKRGMPDMTTSVMPQFLFKQGMAAPYAGMPPRDMFREACWIAASRPMRVISFWNIGNAFVKGEQKTSGEIEAMLGKAGYADTAKTMKEKKLDPFCFDPRLKEEFRSISKQLWEPFGALMPQWKNAPRRVAVISSFASHIFGNVRWPGNQGGELREALARSGVPFDVLLDNDLESGVGAYDVIVLPDGYALPEAGVKHLRDFMKRGGVLIAEERLKVKGLDGVKIVSIPKKGNDSELKRREREIFREANGKTDSPLYIEAMQELQTSHSGRNNIPELDALLKKHRKGVFSTDASNVFWNHLTADGAQYLFVVNDLRIPGEIYGRFGKVREQGVPQSVVFRVNDPKLRYAYDLTNRKEVFLKNGEIRLDLPPCGGNIILFTGNRLGTLNLASGTPVRGQVFHGRVSLNGGSGLIPVSLELFLPDGTRSELSRFGVLRNGVLDWRFVLPWNAPPGTWRIRAEELASGQRKEVVFTVK